MTYNELKELIDLKNISIKNVCDTVGYTRAGLNRAITNETIDLRRIKLLCDYVRISPALFFESKSFGVMINAGGNVQHGIGNKISSDSKDREIELLKQQLELKEEIIRLLKESKSHLRHGSYAAEP